MSHTMNIDLPTEYDGKNITYIINIDMQQESRSVGVVYPITNTLRPVFTRRKSPEFRVINTDRETFIPSGEPNEIVVAQVEPNLVGIIYNPQLPS